MTERALAITWWGTQGHAAEQRGRSGFMQCAPGERAAPAAFQTPLSKKICPFYCMNDLRRVSGLYEGRQGEAGS